MLSIPITELINHFAQNLLMLMQKTIEGGGTSSACLTCHFKVNH